MHWKISKRAKWYAIIGLGSSVIGLGVVYISHLTLPLGSCPWWAYAVAFIGTALFGLFITLMADISSYHYGIEGESWFDDNGGSPSLK